MENQNQRNLILAVVLSALLLFGWDMGVRYFYPDSGKPKPAASASAAPAAPASDGTAIQPTREGGLMNPADIAQEARDIKVLLAAPERIRVAAPGLTGSINPVGGVIDDLVTVRHTATVDKDSGPQRIFSPAGTPAQHFAQFGWVGEAGQVPGPQTVWTVAPGVRLTPQTPVTLSWTSPAGATFTLTYKIDADYMITVEQGVLNAGTAPIAVQPVAQINRTQKTAAVDSFNVHAGPFGAFDEVVNFGIDYDDVAEAKKVENEGGANWLGFTDVYWMSTLIPDTQAKASSDFRSIGNEIFLANMFYPASMVAPGDGKRLTTRLFAGAKEMRVLDRYEAEGIANFGLAIDWGWFRWFERPLFMLLDWLFKAVGNFGVAIILLTVIVRGVMFPIAQKQFASMAAMRAIQPKMKAIQERYKDDRPKQQEEIMALYKKEGVNPLAGCLPIFLQIPVFFALYKVLILSVEMRHQPFALWIKDLSAPDPAHILNLFGLLDFTVPSFLGIGVLAILLGITMWLQFKLNPAPMDPVQEQVFAIMPWLMMFIMAPFAAGLLIYWITSNILTIGQQWYLYSKHPQLKEQAAKEAADAKRARERKA
ncbi:MAG: membrane protein insertase YidC [Brevundimonas sp.]|nr:membrane protein insertase YidC [Brevundimonas sp.]